MSFQKFWGSQFDPRLAQYISNFLFGWAAARSQVVEFHRFAELYVFCTRGTIDERIAVILGGLGQSPTDSVDIAYPLIKEVFPFITTSRKLLTEFNPLISSSTWKQWLAVTCERFGCKKDHNSSPGKPRDSASSRSASRSWPKASSMMWSSRERRKSLDKMRNVGFKEIPRSCGCSSVCFCISTSTGATNSNSRHNRNRNRWL